MPADLYDQLDPLYRAIWGTRLHHGLWCRGRESIATARDQLTERVITALPTLSSGHRIADIGCGYGTLAHRLIRESDCQVFANTASSKQAQFIKPHPHLAVLSGDWLSQNLPNNSLHAALAIESFSHFPSFPQLLAHTTKTLRPGARLVIADWFSETGASPLMRHLARQGQLPAWRPLPSLLTAAKESGLTVIHRADLSAQAAPTWSHLFQKSLALPLRAPRLIPTLLRESLRQPALLWTFPLLRLAYETGDLQYHLIVLQK